MDVIWQIAIFYLTARITEHIIKWLLEDRKIKKSIEEYDKTIKEIKGKL